jgi:hypothetical protein
MAVEGSMMVVTPVSLAAKNMNPPKARTWNPAGLFCLETKDLKCHTSVIGIVMNGGKE